MPWYWLHPAPNAPATTQPYAYFDVNPYTAVAQTPAFINPLRAQFFRVSINTHSHFMPLLLINIGTGSWNPTSCKKKELPILHCHMERQEASISSHDIYYVEPDWFGLHTLKVSPFQYAPQHPYTHHLLTTTCTTHLSPTYPTPTPIAHTHHTSHHIVTWATWCLKSLTLSSAERTANNKINSIQNSASLAVCNGNQPVIGRYPSQRSSNTKQKCVRVMTTSWN